MKYILFLLSFFIFIGAKAQLNFRDSVDVINYEINLEIGNYLNQTIEGNTVITFCPKFDKTKNIKFDLLDLEIEKIKISDKQLKKFDYSENLISIKLDKLINKSDTIKIDIYYSGTPKKDDYWGGFYFTEKSIFNMGVGMASIPPCFGRVWFPCIDNFTDKATYNYNITVENGKTAVCSGILIDKIENKNKTTTFKWTLNQEIPTYLSSVAVANYSMINDLIINSKSLPCNIYVYKGNEAKAQKSFCNLDTCLNIFESLFGDYKWSRIGFVESEFDGGAMEHATNINYPTFAIDGTLAWEKLWVHEFSHNWFGNLVTCEKAEDMWLNEGWASYCEAIFMENFYGKELFRNYVRKNHFEVLLNAHQNDGGYFAICPIPQEITYGSTVYKKGSSIVHTLRNYIGDDLFYAALKKYFIDFSFKNANTEQFKDSMSGYTNIDLTDFFDFWIYDKGFNHFSVSDFTTVNKNGKFEVYLKVKQRLIAASKFANSNKMEVTFKNNEWKTVTKQLNFSGEFGDSIYILDFEPTIVLIDLEEKIEDATTDCYKVIKKSGSVEFLSTLFEANVLKIEDSLFLRVQNNMIEPENIISTDFIISNNQYWTIDGIFGSSKINGNFYFKKDKFINNISKETTNLVLMFRKNIKSEWTIIESTKQTNYYSINNLQSGDYCFAIKK